MDLSNLTQVVDYEITDNGFVFYDAQGNIPDPQKAYWDGSLWLNTYNGESLGGVPKIVNGDLSLNRYQGKTLAGLPTVVKGSLWLENYNGESLEGLPEKVRWLFLDGYNGNDFNSLPKEYIKIWINGKRHTKAEIDDLQKTQKLKSILLD